MFDILYRKETYNYSYNKKELNHGKKFMQSPVSRCIKEARLSFRMSKEKLGLAIGFKKFLASYDLNQYENGKCILSFLILKNIAKTLSVPMAYFYMVKLIKSLGSKY